MNTEISFIYMLNQPHYRSIIGLTIIGKKIGIDIEKIHYRYALIKDHDGIKKPTILINEMKKFEEYYRKKNMIADMIVEGCIKSSGSLDSFLRKLREANILKLNRKLYSISEEYYPQIIKWLVCSLVDSWPADSISEMDLPEKYIGLDENFGKNISEDILNKLNILGFFFGIDFENYNNEDKLIFSKYFSDICKSMAGLASLKYKKTGEREGLAIYVESLFFDIYS